MPGHHHEGGLPLGGALGGGDAGRPELPPQLQLLSQTVPRRAGDLKRGKPEEPSALAILPRSCLLCRRRRPDTISHDIDPGALADIARVVSRCRSGILQTSQD
jgi:hypothetical protein